VSDKGVPTSPVALKSTADYIARYDGPSEFSADYTIVLKADNTVDSSKSFVTFQTINYTSSGVLKKSMFKTFAIPITGVTLDGTGAVQTFQFSTDNKWYTGLPGSLEDKGLTGLIDLVEMVSTYTGTYRSRSNGALSVYTVTGSIKPADAPEPGPQPDEFGDPEIFTPAPEVPEPTSWILAGGGLLATCLLRRRRMIADLTK
jgi:hypothetical protein